MKLYTSRLILRPWAESDAEDLYEYAGDDRIGPVAGWPPHTDVENSREIIRTVLSAEETYAVCLKSDNRCIGSIGLMIGVASNLDIAEDEAEIGYWIGVPFQGQGLISEACAELIHHAFEKLKLRRLWCGYFEGNEKSKDVQEWCGFVYHHTNKDMYWPLTDDIRTIHVTSMENPDSRKNNVRNGGLKLKEKRQTEINDFNNADLEKRFEFRNIRPEEADQAVAVEHSCFPANEACSEKMMKERIAKAPELFMVAVDRETGMLAGILNGLSTDEELFRDEFFTDVNLYKPDGKAVMLLGLAVLSQYRGQGLATGLMSRYLHRERENGRKLVILTCLDSKVEMYEEMGFTDQRIADSTWGNEKWHEMTYELI